ncbi:Uma2 family endonuclease [Zavarzinia sp. CC-PAN008]|uniref:Uma2 family endonuclease n=1 Tax=Zavarzinia sp. CC-PAN008 TaxID=3243332 RepID=UPI003F7476A9
MALAPKRMSLVEFLDWNDGTDTRYELRQGVPVAMAPAIQRHDWLVARLVTALNVRLKPPCLAVPNTGLLSATDSTTFYLPDVLVKCSGNAAGRYAEAPVLVAEVLSPSTKGVDQSVKCADYRRHDSVQDVLLISAEQRHVQHWHRAEGFWEFRDLIGDAEVRVGLGFDLPLAELYQDVELTGAP